MREKKRDKFRETKKSMFACVQEVSSIGLGEQSEQSVITALSAECLKARVCHYTDRTYSHDTDSQEPPRSMGSPLQSYSITPKWTG